MNIKYYVRFFIIFIIVISIIYAIFWGKTGFLKYREIKKEINTERVTVLELEKKILDLESNIKKLKKKYS
jgi:cell division protein FtsB